MNNQGANGQDSFGRWGYRLLALLIAVGMWYGAAAEKRERQSEKVVDAPVTYSTPEKVLILNPLSQVRVGVRGNHREVRRLRPFEVDVQVNLSTAEAGPSTITLTEDDVFLPSESMRVISIDPGIFTLQLDVEGQKRLPIQARTSGEPAAGAIVTRTELIPNTVLVSGPSTLLASVESLQTQLINLNGHALTFEKEVTVITPDPAIRVIRPLVVTVKVTMEDPRPPSR